MRQYGGVPVRETSPKVFLIGQSTLCASGVSAWLEEVGGKKCLQHMSGTASEQLVELAARNCYQSFDPDLNPNLTKVRTDSEEYHGNYLTQGHGSVLEHANSTWAFVDVSRVFTHELVRHRAGCAYSQMSLRYVRLDKLKGWMPPEIRGELEGRDIFRNTFETLEQAQRDLADMYEIESLPAKDKKKLTSAFRRLAPIGLATSIVATFNMRALRHIIEMRTSPAAEVEIRTVFINVGRIAKETWPYFFQDFAFIPDDEEGKMGTWVPEHSKV
jgi:thymidylate synthase (FAD)